MRDPDPRAAPSADRLAPRVQALNGRASALVRFGLSLVEHGPGPDPARALACFDRALAIRLGLPLEGSPRLQYDLAGTWLNRADALVRMTDALMDEAVRSFDAGIGLLERLPLDDDPQFPRRLAIAYQNRGLAHRKGGAGANGAAVLDFVRAIDVLEHERCAGLDDRAQLMATVWVNLADLQAAETTEDAWRRAIQSAHQARRLIVHSERSGLAAAEVSLKARHICCRALARCLEISPDAEAARGDAHAATDTADEGLDLARLWEAGGVTRFRDITRDLFRFGLRAYGVFQPHFVAEFVFDYLWGPNGSPAWADDPEIRAAAEDAVRLTASARASAGARRGDGTRPQ